MLIIDDALGLPVRGLFFIFREIHNAALRERENEAAAIRAALSQLYLMLQTNQVTEGEFDAQERDLLDRLERIEAGNAVEGSEPQA